MAAIVATMLLPPAAGIAWLVTQLVGASFPAIVTFGERVATVEGMLAWWAIFFAAAFAYAVVVRKAS